MKIIVCMYCSQIKTCQWFMYSKLFIKVKYFIITSNKKHNILFVGHELLHKLIKEFYKPIMINDPFILFVSKLIYCGPFFVLHMGEYTSEVQLNFSIENFSVFLNSLKPWFVEMKIRKIFCKQISKNGQLHKSVLYN